MSYSYFRDKSSKIENWMKAKGYSQKISNALVSYFQSKSGLSNVKLYDHLRKTLLDMGYSGTIEDQLSKFFTEKTGIINRNDSERAFWDNTSLDFSNAVISGEFATQSDDLLITEDSNQLVTEQ